MSEREWAGDTFGTDFMHRSLIWALRYSDVRIWYVFTAVLIIPFCLLFSEAARTSWHYFRKRQKCGKAKSLRRTYMNLVMYSQVVIDRFALYAGKRMPLEVINSDVFRELADKPEGFVILSAHVGCYEMAGYELDSPVKPLNALVFANEKKAVMQGRSQLFSPHNIRMIPVARDMSHLFKIEEALANGEIVSIPADRVFGSNRTVGVNLLGATARLPEGPFRVAVMRGLNVLTVNVMKTGSKSYTAYISKLDYDKSAPRRQQVQQLADGYAAELERVLRMYPTQWYNFYEFWT